MSNESILNYLKYQQIMGGDELILPDVSNFKNLLQKLKSPSQSKTPQELPTKFVPIIPQAKQIILSDLPEINLPSQRPQKKLPEFKSISDIYQYLENEHLYEVNKNGVLDLYPIVKSFGAKKPKLCILSLIPTKADLQSGSILSGEDGQLLFKMMAAINISDKEIFCTSVVKNPDLYLNLYHTQKNVHLELVFRELLFTNCKSILILGEKCAQTVLKTGKSLNDLREQKHKLPKSNILKEANIWVIEHPQKLIKSPGLKRQAWNDLKWIQTQL